MSYKDKCDEVVLSRSKDNHTPVEDTPGICVLCGKPLPEGEEMFKFHGYSSSCPKD